MISADADERNGGNGQDLCHIEKTGKYLFMNIAKEWRKEIKFIYNFNVLLIYDTYTLISKTD